MEENRFIYNLPYLQRSEVCSLLNENKCWRQLASAWMGFDDLEVENLTKSANPSDDLLKKWGNYNHTILELFVLLFRMQQYKAMTVLKPFVSAKYHSLLTISEHEKFKTRSSTPINGNLRIDVRSPQQTFHRPAKKTVKAIVHEKPANADSDDQLSREMAGINFREDASSPNGSSTSVASSNLASLSPVPFEELTFATDEWNSKNLVGRGGFGNVYKGIWNNAEVAVKKLKQRGADDHESYISQLEQSFREIKILNGFSHENVLPLYAYSIGGESPCLVYQYMKNGSLQDRLMAKKEDDRQLQWMERWEIARGTARGLLYLHTAHGKPLIHGDIKSANILLDCHFQPKIGDFGLAREGFSDGSLKVSQLHGTLPYLPREYVFERKLSTKVDTYSYGIVMLELSTGLPAFSKSRAKNKLLKDYVNSHQNEDVDKLRDARIENTPQHVFKFLISLGKWCSNSQAGDRPEISMVCRKFKY